MSAPVYSIVDLTLVDQAFRIIHLDLCVWSQLNTIALNRARRLNDFLCSFRRKTTVHDFLKSLDCSFHIVFKPKGHNTENRNRSAGRI